MIYEITAPIALGGTSEYYVIKSADGFGSAGVENVKWNRPGFDGIKVPKAFWRERIIRLVIGVKAPDSATYEEKRRDLQAAFDFPRNGLTWLKFKTVGGLELQTQVQLNAGIQAPLQAGHLTIGDFRIELVAEDPVFYSQDLTETDITFVAGEGTITNNGNAPVYPEVRIHGNVEDPSITNSNMDKTVSLSEVTIGAGHYYDLDMLNETVKDETGTNRYSYVDSDDFFWLATGSNTITLAGTPGGSGHRKVTFSFRDGYIGI